MPNSGQIHPAVTERLFDENRATARTGGSHAVVLAGVEAADVSVAQAVEDQR